MVSATNVLILLSIGAFLVAGGGSLIAPAFAQGKKDFGSIKGGLTDQVKSIKGTLKRNEESMI